MGPYWLRNLYFLYLLELRALSKASAYLAAQKYYTGETEEDVDTQVWVCVCVRLEHGLDKLICLTRFYVYNHV